MKHLLYLLSFCILLSSCNAERRALRKAKRAPVSTTYDLPRPAKGDTARITVIPPPRTAVGGVISAVTGRDKPTITPAGNIILPKKNYGSISISTGSGSSSASVAGKKAAAAVGEGATTTSIGKAKGPTATGDNATATDYTKQGQRGGAAASGEGATATNTPKKGIPGWLFVAGGALVFFGVWRFLASSPWGKLQPWLPSASKAKWIAILLGAGVVAYMVFV